MNLVVIFIFLSALSFILTCAYIYFSKRLGIFDHPNSRSAHKVPTPHGGGLAISIAFVVGSCIGYFSGAIGNVSLAFIMVPALIIAALGFWDDLRPISPVFRLAVHLLAGIVIFLGFTSQYFDQFPILIGIVFALAVVLYAGFSINLYNFMDGADGIVSLQVLVFCIGFATLHFIAPGETAMRQTNIYLAVVLAAAVVGFLMLNFPPARVFMGDCGSGMIGFVVAVLCVKAISEDIHLAIPLLVLQSIFLVDSLITLLRRFLRGEPVYEAHNLHGYQHAIRRYGGDHRRVSVGLFLIGMMWLLPWAIAIGANFLSQWLSIVAVLPILWLCLHYGSGRPKELTNP